MNGYVFFVCCIFDIKMDTIIGPTIAKNELEKGTRFWTRFSVFGCPFWVHFGSHFGVKETMMRRAGPKKDLKSLKVPKSSNCKKCDFTEAKPYFLSLGGSQDEHKRLKTALKRHLKSFKTRKESGFPKLDQFWDRFAT